MEKRPRWEITFRPKLNEERIGSLQAKYLNACRFLQYAKEQKNENKIKHFEEKCKHYSALIKRYTSQ